MNSTQEILHEVDSLPVESRLAVVDHILHSLNSVDPKTDKKWIALAETRLAELRNSKVRSTPGSEVFAKARKRLAK